MGAPQALENAVRFGVARVFGLLGATTPVSSNAKLYSWKKYAAETTDRPPGSFDNPTKVNTFGPLVNTAFQAKVSTGAQANNWQTFVFLLTDFANPFGPTTAEITAALNARLVGITAALEAGGHLSLVDAAAASTTSYLEVRDPQPPAGRYDSALPLLGFVPCASDIANFRLAVTLPTDARDSAPPLVQTWDWNASTDVTGAALATQPVYSYTESTGVLLLTNALNANHTVAATIHG